MKFIKTRLFKQIFFDNRIVKILLPRTEYKQLNIRFRIKNLLLSDA